MLLSLALLFSGRPSAAQPSLLCRDLRAVLAETPDFEALRGPLLREDEDGALIYESTQHLDGLAPPQIVVPQGAPPYLTAKLPTFYEQKRLGPQARALRREIRACLPDARRQRAPQWFSPTWVVIEVDHEVPEGIVTVCHDVSLSPPRGVDIFVDTVR